MCAGCSIVSILSNITWDINWSVTCVYRAMSASYSPVHISLLIFLTFLFVLPKSDAVLSIAADLPMLSNSKRVWPRCSLLSIFSCIFFCFCWVIQIYIYIFLPFLLLIYPFLSSFLILLGFSSFSFGSFLVFGLIFLLILRFRLSSIAFNFYIFSFFLVFFCYGSSFYFVSTNTIVIFFSIFYFYVKFFFF